jgi:cold shock CspA family protein/ribosome-associated translation inhibitor RaiA
MDLEIQSRNVAMTPRWKTEIEGRMADLQQGHEDMVHARVTLIKNRHHKKLKNAAEATVVITLPRRQVITARKGDKTFDEAIRAAFAAVQTELKKFRDKRVSKDLRLPPAPPLRGVVCKLFAKSGYGFILQEGGGEVYFHKHALRGLAFDELEDGTEVVLNVEQGEKGPQATTVQPLSALSHA